MSAHRLSADASAAKSFFGLAHFLSRHLALSLILGVGSVILLVAVAFGQLARVGVAAPLPSSLSLGRVQRKTLLTPSVDELDFGTLPRAGQREATIYIYNPGSSTVKVVKITSSCDCFHVTLERSVIVPGEKVAATAKVDFSDDPHFTGRLRLEAHGVAHSEARDALRLHVDVAVN